MALVRTRAPIAKAGPARLWRAEGPAAKCQFHPRGIKTARPDHPPPDRPPGGDFRGAGDAVFDQKVGKAGKPFLVIAEPGRPPVAGIRAVGIDIPFAQRPGRTVSASARPCSPLRRCGIHPRGTGKIRRNARQLFMNAGHDAASLASGRPVPIIASRLTSPASAASIQMFGSGRWPHRQHQIADLGRWIPDPHRRAFVKSDAEFGQYTAWFPHGAGAVVIDLYPECQAAARGNSCTRVQTTRLCALSARVFHHHHMFALAPAMAKLGNHCIGVGQQRCAEIRDRPRRGSRARRRSAGRYRAHKDR